VNKRRGIELDDVLTDPSREQERDYLRQFVDEDKLSQWDAGLTGLQHFLEGLFFPEWWRDILFERYAQGDEDAYDKLATRLHHICFLENRAPRSPDESQKRKNEERGGLEHSPLLSSFALQTLLPFAQSLIQPSLVSPELVEGILDEHHRDAIALLVQTGRRLQEEVSQIRERAKSAGFFINKEGELTLPRGAHRPTKVINTIAVELFYVLRDLRKGLIEKELFEDTAALMEPMVKLTWSQVKGARERSPIR
jgi:hypothetical protein